MAIKSKLINLQQTCSFLELERKRVVTCLRSWMKVRCRQSETDAFLSTCQYNSQLSISEIAWWRTLYWCSCHVFPFRRFYYLGGDLFRSAASSPARYQSFLPDNSRVCLIHSIAAAADDDVFPFGFYESSRFRSLYHATNVLMVL